MKIFGSLCAGHYMKPSKLISYAKSAGKLSEAIPPLQVLLKAYKVLFKMQENVKMWFQIDLPEQCSHF